MSIYNVIKKSLKENGSLDKTEGIKPVLELFDILPGRTIVRNLRELVYDFVYVGRCEIIKEIATVTAGRRDNVNFDDDAGPGSYQYPDGYVIFSTPFNNEGIKGFSKYSREFTQEAINDRALYFYEVRGKEDIVARFDLVDPYPVKPKVDPKMVHYANKVKADINKAREHFDEFEKLFKDLGN